MAICAKHSFRLFFMSFSIFFMGQFESFRFYGQQSWMCASTTKGKTQTSWNWCEVSLVCCLVPNWVLSTSLFFSPPIAAISVSLAFTRKLNAPTHTHYFHWLLSKHAHMRSECLAMSHFLIVTSEKVSVRFDVTPFNIWVNWEWQRTYNSLVAYIYICTLMRVRWGKQNRNETNGAKSNIYTKSVLQIHWLTSVVAVALNYML